MSSSLLAPIPKAPGRTYSRLRLSPSDREVYISDPMPTSLLKDILAVVDEASGALAVFPEAGEPDPAEQSWIRYPKECNPDVSPVLGVKSAEPSPESSRDSVLTPHFVKVNIGVYGPFSDFINGSLKVVHLPLLAAWESRSPLGVDAHGDTKIAGELDLGNIPNSGVQVLGNPVAIDVREEV